MGLREADSRLPADRDARQVRSQVSSSLRVMALRYSGNSEGADAAKGTPFGYSPEN
jgi:hypothetical protein